MNRAGVYIIEHEKDQVEHLEYSRRSLDNLVHTVLEALQAY